MEITAKSVKIAQKPAKIGEKPAKITEKSVKIAEIGEKTCENSRKNRENNRKSRNSAQKTPSNWQKIRLRKTDKLGKCQRIYSYDIGKSGQTGVGKNRISIEKVKRKHITKRKHI